MGGRIPGRNRRIHLSGSGNYNSYVAYGKAAGGPGRERSPPSPETGLPGARFNQALRLLVLNYPSEYRAFGGQAVFFRDPSPEPRPGSLGGKAMAAAYLQNVKILIVEDNPFMRTIVLRILKAFGAEQIKEAGDGAEAFKIMRLFNPDIIIVDWQMQPLDGIEFARMVRTADDSPNPFVPIIMLSGHSEQNRIMVARDAGVNEFLVKPISAKALFSRIQAVIERPRQFVRTKNYFGPDRRRKNGNYQGKDRRGAEQAAHAGKPSDASMSQDAVNALFNPDTEPLP